MSMTNPKTHLHFTILNVCIFMFFWYDIHACIDMNTCTCTCTYKSRYTCEYIRTYTNTYWSCQDRKPLEAERPQVREDLETTAEKLYDGKLEMVEAPGDPYAAQLAKSKASRVQSAEKVLEKAKKKIEKANKPAASGKGKRGRGAKKNQENEPATGVSPDTGVSHDPKKDGDKQHDGGNGTTTSPPDASGSADAHPTWPEKETCLNKCNFHLICF